MNSKQFFPVSVFNENETIFREGDTGDRMYEVIYGKVGIFINYKKENQQLLKEYGSGEFFGEIALLEVRPRTATAVSLEDDTQLRVVLRKGYTDYFMEKPNTLTAILDLAANRFKRQRLDYFEACEIIEKLKNVLDGKEAMTDEVLEKTNAYIADYQKFLVSQTDEKKRIEEVGDRYKTYNY